MSSGNYSHGSSIANIALPSQNSTNCTATIASTTAPGATATVASTDAAAAAVTAVDSVDAVSSGSLQAGDTASANTLGTSLASSSTEQAYDYYSTPEYQQYYQQYYANAYAKQQQQLGTNSTVYADPRYAAYYASSTGSVGANSATTAAFNIYSQQQQQQIQLAAANYMPVAIQTTATAAVSHLNGSGNTYNDDDNDDDDDDDPTIAKSRTKLANMLPYHCNAKMGLNPLIYTNIQQSPYFKSNLFQLKTYHEVIDEIYYSVKHLEPWEKGSRKVSGQTGMCGSVRGVGAGGIISTPFCLLYKLYTLRLTRKQVNGLIRHKDSPFIRGLGFMFIRYTQPPQDLWQWFEPYLSDEEEIDPKAGGGSPMTIGEMVRYMLTKLDWFSTLFPRIPIPIQKEIDEKLRQYDDEAYPSNAGDDATESEETDCYHHSKSYRSDSAKYVKNNDSSRRSRSRSPSSRGSGHHNSKYHRKDKYDDRNRDDRDRRSNRHSKSSSSRYY